MNVMCDEMNDLDEERLRALETILHQKERVSRYYNKKAKAKSFQVGDLVWKTILPIE